MILYQLHARGRLRHLQGAGQIVSHDVYLSPGAAAQAVAAFKDRCCSSPAALADLDPATIQVEVVELRLDGGLLGLVSRGEG